MGHPYFDLVVLWFFRGLSVVLMGFLVVPLVALIASVSLNDIQHGIAHPMFASALWLTLRTTVLALIATVVMGTPLSWWLAVSSSRTSRLAAILVELPLVIPPAVVGVALLKTFGRHGILGGFLMPWGIQLAFTEQAVILAQLVVASPLYIQASTQAFRRIGGDTLTVARTLGASELETFFRVSLPMTLPGLLVGASLAWARSLGELGATLLFAGNMMGKTQTMPLAIFSALEFDVELSVVFSLALVGVAAGLLFCLRLLRNDPLVADI